jgi:hypothetical protein
MLDSNFFWQLSGSNLLPETSSEKPAAIVVNPACRGEAC